MSDKLTFEFRKCPVIDGRAYSSIEEGKREFLQTLFALDDDTHWTIAGIADRIIEQQSAILAVLTLSENSRPAARKALGATRKARKSRTGDSTIPLPALEDPFKKP